VPIGVGRRSQIEILEETRFPHFTGLLYSAFTAYAGFKVNSGEYKLMGLAPYGEPLHRSNTARGRRLHDDGSLQLDLCTQPGLPLSTHFRGFLAQLGLRSCRGRHGGSRLGGHETIP
jgi:hypothetical protein